MIKKHSLKTKILTLNLILLSAIALLLGSISFYIVRKLSNVDSASIMTQICEKETLRFNNKLKQVEQSVNTIYDYADQLRTVNNIDILSDEFTEYVSKLSVSLADSTDGAMSVYFRLNPEISGSGTDGFFWAKKSDSTVFTEEKTTDILAYHESDTEHVGWYYIPKESGKPLWMSPYYNDNLDVFMVSYVIPYYDGREFIGVIGMDIDFNVILTEAGEAMTYENGKVGLANTDEYKVYYGNSGLKASEVLMTEAIYKYIIMGNSTNLPQEITEADGSTSVICYDTLYNGMQLFVTVPKAEINANSNRLLVLCVAGSALIFVIAFSIITRLTNRMFYPINRLAEITGDYAEGKWSESFTCETGDEIQKLSESIAKMAKNTQSYIADIQKNARTDALTGLGNKLAYIEAQENIKDAQALAVFVLDINLLKRTNDTFGHEMGDKLILEAGRLIGQTFEGCQTFRIGGDEFVALLTGEQLSKRNDYCKSLSDGMGKVIDEQYNIRLFIAYGMAVKGEDGKVFDDLFHKADDRMYEMKKQMKMLRTD